MIRRTYLQGGLGQVHVRVAEPTSPDARGAPLLLFHETPSTSSEYEPLMRALAKDRAVYAFDTPGYGASDGPAAPLSIAGYVGALTPAIERLGLEPGRAVAFGFHTGAVIALELALQRPDLAGALAIAGFPYRPMAERQERLAVLPRQASPAEYRDKFLSWWDLLMSPAGEDVDVDRRLRLFTDMLQSGRGHWTAYEAVWTYDYEARFAELRCPTLFLAPHEMLHDQTLAAARLVPHAQVKDLPQVSEWALERNAAELAAELAAFADRLRVAA